MCFFIGLVWASQETEVVTSTFSSRVSWPPQVFSKSHQESLCQPGSGYVPPLPKSLHSSTLPSDEKPKGPHSSHTKPVRSFPASPCPTSTSLPFAHIAPATLVLLFLLRTRQGPVSGPLHGLFLLPGRLFPQTSACPLYLLQACSDFMWLDRQTHIAI